MTDFVLPSHAGTVSAGYGAAASGARYGVEIVEQIGPAWDAMAGQFADACLEQMAAYAVPRWDPSRLCGVVLREMGSGEPAAIALAVIATIPLFDLGLAYVKFGPLWRRHDRPADPAVLGAALEAVKNVFAGDRGLVGPLMPPPDPELVGEWDKRLALAGFSFHDHAPDPTRYLVDLSLTESEQLASFGSKWRSNLNKALTHRLDIREADLKEGLPDFLSLYKTMLARKHFIDRHNVAALPPFAAAAVDAAALACGSFSPITRASRLPARSSSAPVTGPSWRSAPATSARCRCARVMPCAGGSSIGCVARTRAGSISVAPRAMPDCAASSLAMSASAGVCCRSPVTTISPTTCSASSYRRRCPRLTN